MPTDPGPDDFPTPVSGRRLLDCDRCHHTSEITHADLTHYLVEGWPACCGEVTGYFVEAKRPSLGDSAGRSSRPERRR